MRVACRLASEVLDYIAHIQPGITTAEIDRLGAECMASRAPSRHHRLPAPATRPTRPSLCTSVNNGVPRHPERQAAEEGRHRQRGRHRHHQGRLVWRQQPHVPDRRMLDRRQAACAPSPSRPCGTASRRSSRARAWATSATPSRSSPKAMAFRCANSAATASARMFHEEPQVLHYGRPARWKNSSPAWCSPSNP